MNLYSKSEAYLLGKHLIQNNKYCSVVFFDIDSTLIDNNGRLIPEIYNLYQDAINDPKLKVVIITARGPHAFQYTIDELSSLGIQYDLLYIRPHNYDGDAGVKEFKLLSRRNAIETLGFEPLFSIGDMYWDVGPYSGTDILINYNILL